MASEFLAYYCEWFDHDSEMFWWKKFKKIVREQYKLWDSWDPLDYEPVKKICGRKTKDLFDVAKVCYNHNETYFRQEVMDWMELAQTGERIKMGGDLDGDIRFTRNNYYHVKS